MNNDAIINMLSSISGYSRKQVIETLKKMSGIPEVRKELERARHEKRR